MKLGIEIDDLQLKLPVGRSFFSIWAQVLNKEPTEINLTYWSLTAYLDDTFTRHYSENDNIDFSSGDVTVCKWGGGVEVRLKSCGKTPLVFDPQELTTKDLVVLRVSADRNTKFGLKFKLKIASRLASCKIERSEYWKLA